MCDEMGQIPVTGKHSTGKCGMKKDIWQASDGQALNTGVSLYNAERSIVTVLHLCLRHTP